MTLQKRKERYRSELRAETLSAARELIREEGYEGLTIRKLATRMECSPMALYSYFADKQALLTALALEGFEKVAKRFGSAVDRDPLTALRNILLDYIAYAEESPNEYRILFLSVETIGGLEQSREDLQERNPAFGALFRCVETCIKAGVLQGEAFAVSTVLWTAAHGAAALLITARKFPFGSRQLYAEEVVATIISGVQSRVIVRI
ncbi:TetR/AcrR family transcriptional regulator [Tunturiibacter gelidoferens]|uniref:AcrR family transcriptional regulator n=1 Tax=Tunturiibacter lichenicola TaxID=2051959 RepID=A0A7Y9TBZ8_9BACT|nr:TetR/AcrR family transcriptional regulator [Edaphobacter lichenicola]NYF53610.1 AcrR family transcriptional regulator [Edaphobacter lichenicola]